MTEHEIEICFDELWGARNRLVDGNMHWVQRMAAKAHQDKGVPLEDLLAAGRMGLIAAVQNYKDQKHQFAPDDQLTGGYAIWWVRLEFSRLLDNARDVAEQ